ncbi:MAG TPA: hypothetical protein EYN66_02490, partial [Myxococcales bacterium]|nr:hypothetical protein [Myxococcales bacterium]
MWSAKSTRMYYLPLAQGIRSAAIVLMHSYQSPQHEQALADKARHMGFEHVSVSHELVPIIKLINRGDTTVLDAYLAPGLNHYVQELMNELPGVDILFMQSNGGLTYAEQFHAKDAVLSGPAGGVIGAVQTCSNVGCSQLIAFDMGGTSTDVAHSSGTLERRLENEIAGTHLYAPMLDIHTVAAGGGSILSFQDNRYQVGPESAGALPGPACYGLGGPLTVTDANLFLGKLLPQYFPRVFGQSGDQCIDPKVVEQQFTALCDKLRPSNSDAKTPLQIAEEFIDVAVETMANAVKKISIERGHNVSNYTLCCYGGAGGQHACLVADKLKIKSILIHPDAGLLSAWGMGLAALRTLKEETVERPLSADLEPFLAQRAESLSRHAINDLQDRGSDAESPIQCRTRLHLRYQGSNTALAVPMDSIDAMRRAFSETHEQRFGHRPPDRELIVSLIEVEVSCESELPDLKRPTPKPKSARKT